MWAPHPRVAVSERVPMSLSHPLRIVLLLLYGRVYGRECACAGVSSSCTFPGPTIEVKPGDTLSLTLVNSLGPQAAESHAEGVSVEVLNTPHGQSNTTNVHTHGLLVSPLVDSPFAAVQPGGTHTYVYQIPNDHAPGFHWSSSRHLATRAQRQVTAPPSPSNPTGTDGLHRGIDTLQRARRSRRFVAASTSCVVWCGVLCRAVSAGITLTFTAPLRCR